jgi:hypothetical protein
MNLVLKPKLWKSLLALAGCCLLLASSGCAGYLPLNPQQYDHAMNVESAPPQLWSGTVLFPLDGLSGFIH